MAEDSNRSRSEPDDDQDSCVLTRDDREVIRHQAILESKTDFIADHAWLCWTNGMRYKGELLRFFLVESSIHKDNQWMMANHPEIWEHVGDVLGKFGRFNGYVRFPGLPLLVPGSKGIVTYIPVHGGVTFYQEWWDGSVTYGFDTSHHISTQTHEILNDIGWMMAETESMARGIMIASRFEPYYLNAVDDNQRKAIVLDRMGKFLQLDISGNTGVILNLLGGDL